MKRLITIFLLISLLVIPVVACFTPNDTTSILTSKVIGIEKSINTETPSIWIHLDTGRQLEMMPYADISVGMTYEFTISTTWVSPRIFGIATRTVKVLDYRLVDDVCDGSNNQPE